VTLITTHLSFLYKKLIRTYNLSRAHELLQYTRRLAGGAQEREDLSTVNNTSLRRYTYTHPRVLVESQEVSKCPEGTPDLSQSLKLVDDIGGGRVVCEHVKSFAM